MACINDYIHRPIVDEEEEGSEGGESDHDNDGVNLEESDEDTVSIEVAVIDHTTHSRCIHENITCMYKL